MPRIARRESWDDRTRSGDEIEARERAKREAAMKREMARAYAVAHQLAQVI
jgi:hypothetical protein